MIHLCLTIETDCPFSMAGTHQPGPRTDRLLASNRLFAGPLRRKTTSFAPRLSPYRRVQLWCKRIFDVVRAVALRHPNLTFYPVGSRGPLAYVIEHWRAVGNGAPW